MFNNWPYAKYKQKNNKPNKVTKSRPESEQIRKTSRQLTHVRTFNVSVRALLLSECCP